MNKKLLLIIAGMLLANLWGCSSGGGRAGNAPVTQKNGGNSNTGTGGKPLVYADDYVTYAVEDDYDEGQTACYVGSVNGNDQNNGLSETYPVKSQSAINSSCTVVRFKRGSVFNEKLAIPTFFNNIRFDCNVKVLLFCNAFLPVDSRKPEHPFSTHFTLQA
jgi:hypothetical protein